MKNILLLSAVSLMLLSCGKPAPLVRSTWVDSLMKNYRNAPLDKSNAYELIFWKNRIDPHRPGEMNEVRYAGNLVSRFRLHGDIADLEQAECIYSGVDSLYNHRHPGPILSLASLSLHRHRFSIADTLLEKARKLGVERYSELNISFDILFELGRYSEAAYQLHQLQYFRDYNYYFRKAKFDHLQGKTDSALSAIRKAVEHVSDRSLKSLALSSEGDLFLHNGQFREASQALYASAKLNPSDMHTILAIGWIALNHDQDTIMARRIFEFVSHNNQLPDPIFKLYQLAQWRHDLSSSLYYAQQFAEKASDPQYGRMYNKYLIELYTGVLNKTLPAEKIALDELRNRATGQTYAWYAYCLSVNHKTTQAYQVFEQHISGQPLEPIELYYTGRVLNAAGKGYDAGNCFEAALKNRYDLSPSMLDDIKRLEE